jgi:hypothetical protein
MALTLYDKEKAMAFAREYFEREKVCQVSTIGPAPMPPPSKSNGREPSKKIAPAKKAKKGQPKKTTGGKMGTKRAALDNDGPSKRASETLSYGSLSHLSSSFWLAKPSFPYTIIGMDTPNEGCEKGLMTKKGPKPQIQGQPLGFFGEDEPPKPTESPMIKINKRVKSLSSRIRFLQGRVAEGHTVDLHLGEEISSLHLSFYEELEGVAKAIGLEHALALFH